MSDCNCSIGVDLGGTKLAAGVVTDDGKLLVSDRAPTRSSAGYEAVIQQIVELVRALASRAGISLDQAHSVGVGAAGQIDVSAGVIHHAVNLFPERDIPFGPLIAEQLGLPVVVDNDVRASTLGEYLFGFTAHVESLYNVFVGTGVGSGYIRRNRIMRGHSNSACEVGHHSIRFDGRKCGCGNRGCLEQYTGGLAIARMAREAIQAEPGSLLRELCGGDPDRANGATVAAAAERGDPTALKLIEDAGFYLGCGLANVINLFNPEVLMLGGGVMKIGERFRAVAEKTAVERALGSAGASTRFVSSQLGDAAGLIGASCLWRVDPEGGIQSVR
jgi:glucokinase